MVLASQAESSVDQFRSTWRTGGGIELYTDTASNNILADKVWRLKGGWEVAHDSSKRLSASFNTDYNHSVAGRGG